MAKEEPAVHMRDNKTENMPPQENGGQFRRKPPEPAFFYLMDSQPYGMRG